MEDDLDNLIADSIGGVQTALDGERKASGANGSSAASGGQEWAKEAVRELQQDAPGGGAALGGDFFQNLAKTFQDESFQKAMAGALQDGGATAATASAAEAGEAVAPLAGEPAAAAASSTGTPDAEEFLAKFMQGFDDAVGTDQNFEKSIGSLMTSMLSTDLLCEPLEQISEKLEPWLKSQKGLAQSERTRYEAQLKLYKQVLQIYKSSPDPLPDDAREQVQRLVTELHGLGQPPDEVMKQLAPKDAEDGGQSFEDFVKSMGLDSNLGSAEQDLLKKLSEDPEELTKVMKDMAEGLPEEACKQQ